MSMMCQRSGKSLTCNFKEQSSNPFTDGCKMIIKADFTINNSPLSDVFKQINKY